MIAHLLLVAAAAIPGAMDCSVNGCAKYEQSTVYVPKQQAVEIVWSTCPGCSYKGELYAFPLVAGQKPVLVANGLSAPLWKITRNQKGYYWVQVANCDVGGCSDWSQSYIGANCDGSMPRGFVVYFDS
jgi:hypothetical protein